MVQELKLWNGVEKPRQRDVLLRKMGSSNGVFDGFRICPIDDLYKRTRDVALPYKQTARHWTNCPGSIYIDDPHAS